MHCWLTFRSTGPIAAGWHLGYKSLAQVPACRNGPVSSNVRRQNLARGAEVREQPMTSGLQAIQKTPGGFFGGADPRREGLVLGD